VARSRARVGDAVKDAICTSVDRFFANEVAVAAGAEPEAVHQARVATRRLRSDLKTFKDFVDPEWASQLRGELHWMGGELGRVRDIEVLLERLRAEAEYLDDDRAAAERVIRRLVREWQSARDELLSATDSERYTHVVDLLRNAAANPRLTDDADARATKALAPVVRKPWKKLRKAVDRLDHDPSDKALHRVRITAKRCRYAAEATSSVYGKRAEKFATQVADLQDVLGNHQDAVVAQAWLERARRSCPADERVAIKLLREREARAAGCARDEFPDAWRAVRARRPSTWL
jgi:CHAD domain-containing protein